MATHTLTALDTFAWLGRVSLDPDAAFDRVTTWLAAQPDTGFDVYAGEMR